MTPVLGEQSCTGDSPSPHPRRVPGQQTEQKDSQLKRITIRSNKGDSRILDKDPTPLVRLNHVPAHNKLLQSKGGTRAGHCSLRRNKPQNFRGKKKKDCFSHSLDYTGKQVIVGHVFLLFIPGPPMHTEADMPRPSSILIPISKSALQNFLFFWKKRCQPDPFSWDLANPFLHTLHGFNRTSVNTAPSTGCCCYVACSQSSESPKSAWKASRKQTATQQRHSFTGNHVTKA